ncbi:choice-of-anchor J domain-containing protein [Wenyingzhuangia sp. IMCC45574]
MKNIKHIAFATSMLLFSCTDTLEDTYDELGDLPTPIKSTIQYTLTEDDFKTMELSGTAFESFVQAEELIPLALNKVLPIAPGASVELTIDVYNDNNTTVQNLFNAEEVTLVDEDYPTAKSGAFHPDETANDLLAGILDSKIPSPVEDNFYKITYNNFTEEPILASGSVIKNFDFTNETFNGWTPFNINGDEVWKDATGFGNIQMSGFSGSAKDNEDWLVSPEIDLTDKTDLKFQIEENLRYGTDLSNLKVLISEDYTGDVATATWTELTVTNRTIHSTHSLTPSDIIDFSAYDEKIIHIAFKYISTTSDSMRWLIGNVTISKGEGDEYTGETETLATYYQYDGTEFVIPENMITLTDADYTAMGTEAGRPGERGNFSSSINPDNYLPTYLANKYTYAQNEEQVIVLYKYFSGYVQTRFDLYEFKDGAWILPETTTATPIRFAHKKGSWSSDNPIIYTFTSDDFDWLETSSLKDDTTLVEQVSSAAQYNNFDRRPGGSAYWTNEMILKALNVFLKDRFPEAEEGDVFAVFADTYTGSRPVEEFRVILTEGEYVYVEE